MRVRGPSLRWLPGVLLLTTLLALTAPPRAMAAEAAIRLSETCPPGFELRDGRRCLLRNLYEFYDSLQGAGLGGTRTHLPPHRDGFSPQQIDLGRYLFFDPLLSADRSLSCASCHDPALGFSDARPRSSGIGGAQTPRAAPSLWNAAFLKRFFWDGRAASLEEQAQGSLYSPVEMGHTPDGLLAALAAVPEYRRLFDEAFPGGASGVSLADLYTALAAFQSSLVSLNSRYDRYALGHAAALDAREIAGLNVFRSFVARCSECHTPPLFTNQQLAVIGAPEPEGRALDVGAEAILHAPKLKGAFKVPTLRNIALTAPYMHSGRFATLRETVDFYNRGRGHAIPPGVAMYPHWHIVSPELREEEVELLVAFLATLSDQSLAPAVPERLPSGLAPFGQRAAGVRLSDNNNPATGDPT